MTDQSSSGGAYPPPPGPPGPGGYEPPSGAHEAPPTPSAPQGGSYPPPPPPPGGGSYPPPPPPSGGYAPPPPGPAVRALPTESYTPWLTRVVAFLIDNIPAAVLIGIGSLIEGLSSGQSCSDVSTGYEVSRICVSSGPSTLGMLAFWVTWLLAIGYLVWNYGYRQGTTGSSLGKSVMKFKVVSEVTGQPIGFGMSIVRQLAHFVDQIACYIGYLFPLWDAKRQTFADKIMTTVCLPIEQS